MRAELRDSLEFLYSDSRVEARPCERMDVDVARGGTAAVHVLLNGLTPGAAVSVSVTRNGRPASGAEWFRLVDVPVEKNTGLIGYCEKEEINPHVARRAPFRVYDAMEPLPVRAGRTTVKAAAETMALRLHLSAAGTPGTRTFRLVIESGGDRCEGTFTVRVYRTAIPPIGRDSFPVANWYRQANIIHSHHLDLWSPAHWRMLRRYAELMARGRQNVFRVSLGEVFDLEHDRPVLNRPRLRRMVDLFTGVGMHYIEGGFLAGHTAGWKSATFDIALGPKVRATSTEGNAMLACIGGQLVAEIDRQGWRDRWIQHVADEPSMHNVTDYRLLCGMIRRHMPGLPLIDCTDLDPANAAGSVDMWCPKSSGYHQLQSLYEGSRAQGDRVWIYTCCYPGGPHLNRLLDMELIRPCLIGWASAFFKFDGYMRWGLNAYTIGADPFNRSVREQADGWALPAGDTHVVYPGPDGPWSSVRFEAEREGYEDYELLQLLRRRHHSTADAVMGNVIRALDEYTKDVRTLRAARRKVLTALEK